MVIWKLAGRMLSLFIIGSSNKQSEVIQMDEITAN